MPWLEAAVPARMERVAIVAPEASLREVLVTLADAGLAEIDLPGGEGPVPPAARRLPPTEPGPGPGPALSARTPDLDRLERAGRHDLLAGEADLQAHASAAVRRAGAAALAGWIPARELPGLAERLAKSGGALVPLPHPRGVQAPTLLAGQPVRRALMPLVRTYGTVPYADIDPSWLAWISYVLMFGMMFGDVADGLLLVAAGVGLRAGWPRWARRWRAGWPFVGGAGLAATAFGLLYGEFFGPTGLVPTLWLNPLDEPVTLLATAIAAGGVLLAGAYALGTVNRWREGGWPAALYAPSGIAGAAVFLGIAIAAGAAYIGHGLLLGIGASVAGAGLLLAFTGFFAEAGGRGTGAAQASVEIFDLVIRLGANVVSFARLAAFGLAHAALGLLVWDAVSALWRRGGAALVAALVVFAVGTALAFALEALVAAIQALRLEYYELFSRVFQMLGREFRPWHVPVAQDGGAAPVTAPGTAARDPGRAGTRPPGRGGPGPGEQGGGKPCPPG